MGTGEPSAITVTSLAPDANSSSGEVAASDDPLHRHMVAYQAGSIEAFHDLYEVLSPTLRRYLRYLARSPDIADDLLQDTFLQIHRSRATYDPQYPVAPWAFALARNVYLMHRRATSRFRAVHVEGSDLPDVPVPSDIEHWADQDLLRRALSTLDADQAEPLLLHHVWGFSFEEIAGMVGLSAAAARARSSRAMAALREVVSQMKGSK